MRQGRAAELRSSHADLRLLRASWPSISSPTGPLHCPVFPSFTNQACSDIDSTKTWNSLVRFAQKAQVFVDQNLQPALNQPHALGQPPSAGPTCHQFRLLSDSSQKSSYTRITAELTFHPRPLLRPSPSGHTTQEPRAKRNN